MYADCLQQGRQYSLESQAATEETKFDGGIVEQIYRHIAPYPTVLRLFQDA